MVREDRLMTLTWPWALVALVAVPLLLGALWLVRLRRRKLAVRVSNVAAIRAAIPAHAHWKRRIPLALLIASLLVLGVGVARPTAEVTYARSSTSVLLAIDVSRSMCSTDVQPNRLVVAQDAARRFIRSQNDGTQIGLVAFAGFAALVVPSTTDQHKLIDAIDKLTTSRGTAIGMAILASIDAIAEHNSAVAPTGVQLGGDQPGTTAPGAGSADTPAPAAPPVGDFQPDTIVVLTDGANTRGVEPLVAAGEAAARHIRVYTIGFGTTSPSQPVCNIDQLRGDAPTNGPFDIGPPPGTGFGPGGRFAEIDEKTLQAVADTTGGQYFRAEDADQLDDVFRTLPREVVEQHRQEELTVWFVLVASVLAAAAIALSLRWNRYP
jgi:Ca-activated chloride channel family protein